MKFEEIMKNLTLIQNYVNAWYKPINDEEYRRVYKRVNELLTDTKHKIERGKTNEKKKYIEQQWKRVLSNLTIILEMTAGCNQNDLDFQDLELIYSCANDSMCRLEEIQQYILK